MFEPIHLLSIRPITYIFSKSLQLRVASKYIYYDEKVSSLFLLNVLHFDQEEIDFRNLIKLTFT